ncbi:hypothetical protein ACFZAT_31030 [Streptomyces sp. NPDC008163]|uniref:hypothetical protein n=1 Tax=Streptomyces sp. NPDC008163 TaxID=3364818 RepID=UPI0036E00785
MDTQQPEPGANDMASAREFTRHANEALDMDRPEAARAFADLALFTSASDFGLSSLPPQTPRAPAPNHL